MEIFDPACKLHDQLYEGIKSKRLKHISRYDADRIFLKAMLAIVENKVEKKQQGIEWANRFYKGVRLFGWLSV